MNSAMTKWFLAMPVRWKLQFSFFMVTMVTILINRWEGYRELEKIIHIARTNDVAPAVISQLDARLSSYLTDSIWQSGLEFIILFVIIGFLANILVRPIKALCKALEGIEKGDLSVRVPNHSCDEVGILERSFNSMLSTLTNIMRNIDESGKQMAQSAYQVASISHEIADVSKNEHSRSAEVTEATNGLHQISESVQNLAEEAQQRATETEERARQGVKTVRVNIEKMEDTVKQVNRASEEVALLSTAAEEIYDIIGTIRTITEQTNLLALNAAVEAARAGEQGRGFAVVADEVRNLAKRTTGSTVKITEIINRLKGQVDQVSSTMATVVDGVHASQDRARESEKIIEHMADVVSITSTANNKISQVSQQQVEQLNSLRIGLDRLFETFKVNSTKVETTATIGDDLYRVTERLNKLLSQFNFNVGEISAPKIGVDEKRKTPRMESYLRVQAITMNGAREGTSNDISMSGMQLRVTERMNKGEDVKMKIYLPYKDLEQYRKQKPVTVDGKVVWEKKEGKYFIYGMEFERLTTNQVNGIKVVFDYFNRPAYFSEPAPKNSGSKEEKKSRASSPMESTMKTEDRRATKVGHTPVKAKSL